MTASGRPKDVLSDLGIAVMRERLLADLPVSERRLDVDGVETAVLEGGDGAPVVLLHGVGSFAPEWGGVIPELARRHRIIAPDLPGLGESAKPPGRLDATAAVAWLQSVIAQTCAEMPIVVGHSVGGALAAHLAIHHRSSVRRIVLVDCSSLGRFRPAPALVVALVRYGARPSAASRDRFLRQVLADPERARREWGDRWAALEAYDIDQATRTDVDAANRELVRRIGARRIPPDQLRRIGVPVALIWGRADKLMRFRIAEKASEQFGWPLYPIDACGHGPHIERPEAFVEALKAATAAA